VAMNNLFIFSALAEGSATSTKMGFRRRGSESPNKFTLIPRFFVVIPRFRSDSYSDSYNSARDMVGLPFFNSV